LWVEYKSKEHEGKTSLKGVARSKNSNLKEGIGGNTQKSSAVGGKKFILKRTVGDDLQR